MDLVTLYLLQQSIVLCGLSAIALEEKRCQFKRPRKLRSIYIRKFYRERKEKTEFSVLVQDLRSDDPELHYEHFRMSKGRFDHLLSLVQSRLTHKGTHLIPVSPAERLSLTLTLLSSGGTQRGVARRYRMAKSTVKKVFHETCGILWDVLQPVYMPAPTSEKWEQAANRFWEKWQFPNCIGAIDGKHVEITAPFNSGSTFFNYKDYFSMVLLASVDADYCFQIVDVGGYGSQSDGGTFSASMFGRKLANGQLNIPNGAPLPHTEAVQPRVFVADAAFPLRENIMRPYPEKGMDHGSLIFNYRFSRARRIVENAFGILVHRWRILRQPVQCEPKRTESIIKACTILHNYLIVTEQTAAVTAKKYNPPNFADFPLPDGSIIDGEWRANKCSSMLFSQQQLCTSNRFALMPLKIRDVFKEYFISALGAVPWQDKVAYGVAGRP